MHACTFQQCYRFPSPQTYMYTHIVIIVIRYTELRCMWKQCTYWLMVSQFTKIPHPSLSFPLPLLRFLLLYPQAHRNGNEFITSDVQLLATFRIWQKSTKAMLTFIFVMHEWVFQLLGSETMIRCIVYISRGDSVITYAYLLRIIPKFYLISLVVSLWLHRFPSLLSRVMSFSSLHACYY